MKAKVVKKMIDASFGEYIPQIFAKMKPWRGVSLLDREFILKGPEHEGYWPAWDRVLHEATMEIDGYTYRLHQNGDLFAYREARDEREAQQLRNLLGA